MLVIWADTAKTTFELILNQVENRWGEEIALSFYIDTHQKIELIAKNPLLYKEVPTSGARQAIISRQTSMIYKVLDDQIVIMFFFDNRQEPFL